MQGVAVAGASLQAPQPSARPQAAATGAGTAAASGAEAERTSGAAGGAEASTPGAAATTAAAAERAASVAELEVAIGAALSGQPFALTSWVGAWWWGCGLADHAVVSCNFPATRLMCQTRGGSHCKPPMLVSCHWGPGAAVQASALHCLQTKARPRTFSYSLPMCPLPSFPYSCSKAAGAAWRASPTSTRTAAACCTSSSRQRTAASTHTCTTAKVPAVAVAAAAAAPGLSRSGRAPRTACWSSARRCSSRWSFSPAWCSPSCRVGASGGANRGARWGWAAALCRKMGWRLLVPGACWGPAGEEDDDEQKGEEEEGGWGRYYSG